MFHFEESETQFESSDVKNESKQKNSSAENTDLYSNKSKDLRFSPLQISSETKIPATEPSFWTSNNQQTTEDSRFDWIIIEVKDVIIKVYHHPNFREPTLTIEEHVEPNVRMIGNCTAHFVDIYEATSTEKERLAKVRSDKVETKEYLTKQQEKTKPLELGAFLTPLPRLPFNPVLAGLAASNIELQKNSTVSSITSWLIPSNQQAASLLARKNTCNSSPALLPEKLKNTQDVLEATKKKLAHITHAHKCVKEEKEPILDPYFVYSDLSEESWHLSPIPHPMMSEDNFCNRKSQKSAKKSTSKGRRFLDRCANFFRCCFCCHRKQTND